MPVQSDWQMFTPQFLRFQYFIDILQQTKNVLKIYKNLRKDFPYVFIAFFENLGIVNAKAGSDLDLVSGNQHGLKERSGVNLASAETEFRHDFANKNIAAKLLKY